MQGLLQLIEAERRSDTVNRLLLQHLLRMLTALGIYEDAFQVGEFAWFTSRAICKELTPNLVPA